MTAAELLERFRVLSLERVGRIEAAWNRLIPERENEALVQEMQRELHTLKGDALVVGIRDVQQLCQKLEDLLRAAEQMQFEISDDIELLVTMAIQFLGMLLRMKPGQATGLDLDGFVRQVDEVLHETTLLPAPPRRPRKTSFRVGPSAPVDRLAETTRQQLAAAATSVFLEYVGARSSTTRSRLRTAWTTLRTELARIEGAELDTVLRRHVGSARELAEGLGKWLGIELALDNARVEPRVAEAVDTAVLHLIRNAIDHGIEEPAVRKRAGKSEQGRVQVTAKTHEANLEITVEDDGSGIDVAAVRAKATANGLIDPGREVDEARLLELLFTSGFSTRRNVTEISGRGVGMDAVKAAITAVGGTVKIASSTRGTTITLVVPAFVRTMHAYQFLAPGSAIPLAVSGSWMPTVEPGVRPDALDALRAIQLGAGSRQTGLDPLVPGNDITLRLRWGFLEVSLRAATEPTLVTAERICATSDEHPVEIISINGREAVLLRPEHITELAAGWRRPSPRPFVDARS